MNMENDFDYQSVPYDYAHCFIQQCAQSATCLRHLVATHSTSQKTTLSIINPLCIPADTTVCPYFKSNRKLRMAWGIRYLLENVPYKYSDSIRQQLISHFGRTNYYRFYRHERVLLPEDQAYVRQLFHQYGIEEEPRFEKYSDEYYYG